MGADVRSILMTADTVGGVWTYALTLAEALREHDIAVCLASMGGPAPPHNLPDNVELFESDYRLEWMEDPWDDVRRAGDWLLDLERRLSPDLIHINGYAHAALNWSHPTLVVAHSCVLSWWRAVKGEEADRNWNHYRGEVRRGLAAADAVVTPSRAMLHELNRSYGPVDGFVVPNACFAERYKPAAKESLIFSAGRLWDEAKNVAALDGIASDLEWPVHVAGDGFTAHGAHPLGRLTTDEMRVQYARASIYALPARYEPFGLSILEAALSGCALVLGDIPSLRENWDGAAVFVEPCDRDALRRALRILIADNQKRGELAALARQRGFEFAPRRMANAYLEVYGSIKIPQCV